MRRSGRGGRITAKIPTALAAFERYRLGEEPVDPNPNLGLAANFLYMLTGEEPDDIAAETFNQALILTRTTGLNASTFTSMVIGSTMADIYSAVTGGISALSGPLHGGANQDVMEVLIEIDERPDHRVGRTGHRAGPSHPGFGHRVYNVRDLRAKILQERSKANSPKTARTSGTTTPPPSSSTSPRRRDSARGSPERRLLPAPSTYQLGIPIDMYTPSSP